MMPETKLTIKVTVTTETGFGMKVKQQTQKIAITVGNTIPNFESKLNPEEVLPVDEVVEMLEDEIVKWAQENGKYISDYDGNIHEPITNWLSDWQEFLYPEIQEDEE